MLQESDKKKITKTISALGRHVTAADVSAKSGLPVLVTSQALNQIASETGGHLQVSNNGVIAYSFKPGFSNIYLAEGLRKAIEKAAQRIFEIAFFILRISFGVMLILSTIIVVGLLFILSQSKRKRSRGLDLKFDWFDYIVLRDLKYFFRTSPAQVKYDYSHPTVRRRQKPNFLLDCFSFLFGDGNPNEGLDEKRWQLIAKVIKQHDNVITAEQLAPYTGADPQNETAVLPVLVRFNGQPEVTESGNIVYTFPSLAATAGAEYNEPTPKFLQEFHWKFCELDRTALTPIYMIAGLNFLGAWILWFPIHTFTGSWTATLLGVLAVYGTLFLLIPLLRNFALKVLNKSIDKRNERRSQNAQSLLFPDVKLKRKIAESREYRLRDQLIGQNAIVYSTDKASLDQEDDLALRFQPGDPIDARPEESFDARPLD
ncbi:MAG: hypothetical protein K2X81_15245 [Candidatus Obscuribacterales bacterium]|nr:hypothetical protein [Candidatus Obscuribacterales bacterium]